MGGKMPIAVKLIKNGEDLPEIIVECDSILEIEKKLKDKLPNGQVLVVNLTYPITCYRVWHSVGRAVKYDLNFNTLGNYQIFIRATSLIKTYSVPIIKPKPNLNYNIAVPVIKLEKKKPQKCKVEFILINSEKFCETTIDNEEPMCIIGI